METMDSVRGAPKRKRTGALGDRPDGSALASADSARRSNRAQQSAPSSSRSRTAQLEALARAFRHLFRIVRGLRGRDTHLGGSEVSHAQFELLIELYDQGPLPAGELASAAELTPATVTQMLDHLAESGQVERTRLEADRRVVVSSLTRQGERKVEGKRAAWQARWAQALADVDGEELLIATRVLERISAVFDEPPNPSG
jgi:MarR family transcriptional regulator, organic hydroperoxide resistance regulator